MKMRNKKLEIKSLRGTSCSSWLKFLFLVSCVLFLAAPAAAYRQTTNTLNGGELSPLLEGRSDIEKYYSGCRTLENFLVLSHGGVTKRPGTAYIATAKTAGDTVRLIPFEYSTEQAYILEFGDEYIRFYKDSGQITSGGSAYEIVSPYDKSDLFELQYIQSADVMYIVHPDYAPRQLTRTGHTAWTISAVDFQRGPFLAENTTDITITPSATTGTITLTASDDIFDANHVGALWQINHTIGTEKALPYWSGTDTGTEAGPTVQLGRRWELTTHGTWNGVLKLEKSYDGTNWTDEYIVSSVNDDNRQAPGIEERDDAVYRLNMESHISGTIYVRFYAFSHEIQGVVRITAVTSATSATATVVNTLGGTTATARWAEGAFSEDEGYPRAVAFYEERLAFAGTRNSPQTIWMSQTNDWPNFYAGAEADQAISYTIASDKVNAIYWMAAANSLLLGTSGGEWKLNGGNNGEALSPSVPPVCRRQSSYGSEYLQPQLTENVVLYVQRQSKKIREMAYSFEQDGYVSPDMTILADHITGTGITQTAFSKTPDPILWCVTGDGYLAELTYNREQNVTAWSRIVTDGDIESAAVIPGDGEDEVWVSVKRTIDGTDYRYIEQFSARDFGSDQADAILVDSSLSFDGGDSVTITGVTNANPAVVTAAGHGFADGEQIRFSSVGGMTQLNNKVFTVDSPGLNSFTLYDKTNAVAINSSAFSTYTSGGSCEQVENTFTTLSHLEGQTVQVAADGGYYGTETVSSGTVTLADFYNKVHIGLGYTAKLLPQRLEVPGGNLTGREKRITKLTMRFNKSLSCRAGVSWTEYDNIVFRDADDLLEAASPLYSGDKEIDFDGDWDTQGDIYILNELPVPCTILSITTEFDL